ncbi:unnamed protein product [Adineta steineri]|uniref:G-protein coupled receptors family 1 profile domain-containing protein n=1 Tax=Adineta steineri TaxID=433720 RepID=A0A819UM73_9BILA|nr:unnamed protein product [Adineta steineri]
MASNSITSNITSSTITSSIATPIVIFRQFVDQLPLIFVIFGLIGFLGNVLTYLQSELRSNTCCIYSLIGSLADVINLLLNLFANYLKLTYGITAPWLALTYLCPVQMASVTFLPYLSLNFLLMAIIDRYASTSSLTSSIRRLTQLKMAPWCILITIFISCLTTIRIFTLYEYRSTTGCTITQPLTNNILYIIINGLMQPITIFIFVILTFRNIRNSRRRVATSAAVTIENLHRSRNQFIKMIFVQIFVTAIISLQWTIMFSSVAFLYGGLRNLSPRTFYLSLLTSRLFRETLIQTLFKFLPFRYRNR